MKPTQRAAMEKALEALEAGPRYEPIFADEAENALRAALEEPEPEPVAWMCPDDPERETAFSWSAGHCENCGEQRIPVYIHNPHNRKE